MHCGGNYEDVDDGDDEKYDANDDDSQDYKTMMTMRTMTKGWRVKSRGRHVGNSKCARAASATVSLPGHPGGDDDD